MDKSVLKDELQKIIDICRDGIEGYETAASNIKKDDLKTLFLRLSQQRKAFVEEVKVEALRLGIELDTLGTVKGFFHRTWLATKATFSSDTNEKVVEESIRGEEAAIDVYNEVTADHRIPVYLQELLAEQQRLIKVAVQQLYGIKAEVNNT